MAKEDATNKQHQHQHQQQTQPSRKRSASPTITPDEPSIHTSTRQSKKSEPPAVAESIDTPVVRVTKRGRRPKRVTDGESDAVMNDSATNGGASRRPSQVNAVSAAVESATAASADSTSNRRRTRSQSPATRARTDENADAAPAAASSSSISPVPNLPSPTSTRPRPSMGPSNRKRWSRLPVELFGSVVAPPTTSATIATPSISSQPESQSDVRSESPSESAPSQPLFSTKARASMGGLRRADFAARRSLIPAAIPGSANSQADDSIISPKRSGRAMLAAARRISESKQTSASPSTHHTPITDPLTLLSSPIPDLSDSSSGPIISARNKDQTAARLSFTRFPGPGEETIVPGAFDPTRVDAFTTGVNRSTSNASSNTGKVTRANQRGARAVAVASSKKRPTNNTRATTPTTTVTPPTSTPTPEPALVQTSAPPTLFSTKARTQRMGATKKPTAATAATTNSSNTAAPAATTSSHLPMSSPTRPSVAPSKAAPSGSPSASASSSTGALTARAKFDLAASLQRPVGWQMKKGAVKPLPPILPTAAITSTASSTSTSQSSVVPSSKPSRQTQLKAKEFTSTNPLRSKALQQRSQAARLNKINQARKQE